jgi:hypothetical protein
MVESLGLKREQIDQKLRVLFGKKKAPVKDQEVKKGEYAEQMVR